MGRIVIRVTGVIGLMIALGFLTLTAAGAVAGEDEKALAPDYSALAPLAPFVGKTWRGEGQDPDGAVFVDVSRWDWILGGRAVRIVHSLNDGAYGGQTTVFPDPETGSLKFHYVTTDGFVTEGAADVTGGSFISREKVTGHPTITEVRATARMDAAGKVMTTTSEYLKNGEWVPGNMIRYVPAPEAELVFPILDHASGGPAG